MADKKEALYNSLKEQGLYTKDFSEFERQFSTPEKVGALYAKLNEQGLYTKSLEDFNTQFFQVPKKAPEVSGQESDSTSQTSTGLSQLSQPSDLLPKSNEIPLVLTDKGAENYTGELTGSVNVQASLRDFETLQMDKGALKEWLRETPEDTPEQRTERSNLAWELIQGVNNGVNMTVRGLSRLPAFIYDIAAIPQNAIVRAIGREDLVVRGDYDNVVSEFLDPYIEQRQTDIQNKYGTSVIENFQKGEYSDGVRLLANQVSESIPFMVAIGATGGSAGASLTLGGSLSAEKYADIQDSDVSDALKLTNAIVSGYSELALERVGTGTILRTAENILRNSGREAAEEFTKRSFTEVYEQALKKFFPVTAPIAEGSEEMATQFVENVMDRITGVDPERDLRTGLMDAFVVGSAAGSAISTPVSIANKISNKAKKRQAEELVAENEAIIQTPQEDLTQGEAQVLSDKFKANNEAINEILAEETQAESTLTPDQVAQVRATQERINDIDNLIAKESTPETLKQTLESEKARLEDTLESTVQQTEESIPAEQTETTTEQLAVQGDTTTVTPEVEEVTNTIVSALTNQDSRTSMIEERKQRIRDYWASHQNLGISPSSRPNLGDDARVLRDLIELAALSIVDGTIKTANSFKEMARGLGVQSEQAINQAYYQAVDIAKAYSETNPDRISVQDRQGQLLVKVQERKQPKLAETKVTAKTVKNVTEGGIQGTETVTSKQALTNQIRTLNRGIKEGIRQQKEVNRNKSKQEKYEIVFLKSEINTVLDNAKKEGIFSGSVRGNLANRLANQINKARTPRQLVRAIENVENTVRDIEYTNKRSEANANARRLKRQARVKAEPKRGGLPQNVKNVLRELGSVTPTDPELLEEYNTFTNNVLAQIRDDRTVNVAQEDVTSLMDKVRREQQRKRQERIERTLEIMGEDTEGLSFEDMTATYEALRDKPDTEFKDDPRDAMEAVTEVLRDELQDTDLTDIEEQYSREIAALRNIDVATLTPKELQFLNNALTNLINNQRVDGVGAVIVEKHKLNQNLAKLDTDAIKRSILALNTVMKRVMQGIASASVTIKGITSNVDSAAKIRNLIGLTELLNKEKTVNDRERLFEESIIRLTKKHRGLRTAKSQMKISIVAELMQYKSNLTAPEEIMQEFEGRKEAIKESINRTVARLDRDSDFRRDYKNYADGLVSLWESTFEDVNSPEEAIAQLNEGETELYNYLLRSFAEMKSGMQKVTEVYGNSQWVGLENYIPRSYLYLNNAYTNTEPNVTESSFVAGQPIKGTVAGGANQRVLNGSQLPADGFLNFDLFNGVIREFRNQLYDVETLPTRHYVNHAMASPEIADMIGDDAVMNIINESLQRTVDSQKRYRLRGQSRSVWSAFWRFYSGLGNKLALGGILSYAKQFAPTLATTQFNMRKGDEMIPMQVMHLSLQMGMTGEGKGKFANLVNQFPVSDRHRNSSGLFFQSVNNLKFDRLTNDIKATSASDVLARALNRGDEISDITLAPLTRGDQTSATIAWLSYYIAERKKQGAIKEFKDFNWEKEAANPNEDAVGYAEMMTSATLNTNLQSESSKFMQSNNKWLPNILIPFASFQINEFANMTTDVNVLSSKNVTSQERAQAFRRIGARVAGLMAINAVGWGIRDMFTRAGYELITAMVAGDDEEDEELKEEIITKLNQSKDEAVLRNLENSLGYAMTDLVFGQMTGDIGTNFTTAAKTIVNEATGQENKSIVWQDTFGNLGKLGIPAKSLFNLIKSSRVAMTTDKEWRENSYTIKNAYGEAQMPPEYSDEKMPFYSRATMSFATLAAVPQLIGFSTQEVGSLNRAMQRAAKVADKEQNRIGKKWEQEELDSDLTEFSFEGVKYMPDEADQELLKELRGNYLRTIVQHPTTSKDVTYYDLLKWYYKEQAKAKGEKIGLQELENKIRNRVNGYARKDLFQIREGKVRTEEQVLEENEE